MKRHIFVMIMLGSLFAGAVYFLPGLQRSLLSVWEMMTGQYVTVREMDAAGFVTEKCISKTEQAWSETSAENNRQKELGDLVQSAKEDRSDQAAERARSVDTWTETVSGYLVVETEECSDGESCTSVEQADFQVTGDVSERVMANLSVGKRLPIGCLEISQIRSLPLQNLKTKEYVSVRGTNFSLLKASNADHPVRLTFTKPAYPADFVTEGLTCMTPFVDFQVTSTPSK